MELATVIADDFKPFVGQEFTANDGEIEVAFRLVEVTIGYPPIPGLRERHSFSVTFASDFAASHPGHVTITLSHPEFGTLEHASLVPNSGAPKPEWGDVKQIWSLSFG